MAVYCDICAQPLPANDETIYTGTGGALCKAHMTSASNETSVQFVVLEAGRGFALRWRIAGVEDPAEFLYWAYQFGARYAVHQAGARWLEFVAQEGVVGEYPRGLYWDRRCRCPWRTNLFTTHKLTQHGLDGLPRQFYASLPRQAPIFRIESREGVFTLTLEEWTRYFVSGHSSRRLIDLAQVPHVRSNR